MAATTCEPEDATFASPDSLKVDGNIVFETVKNEYSTGQQGKPINSIHWVDPSEPSASEVKHPIPEDRRSALLDAHCEALRSAAAITQSHVQNLDDILSKWLRCKLQAPRRSIDDIANETTSVLSRLQESPQPLEQPPESLPAGYFAGNRHWGRVHVVTCVPKILVRLITYSLNSAEDMSSIGYDMVLNGVGALIDAVCTKESWAMQSNDQQGYLWFVVRAFLWTIWQRTRTLYSYFILRRNLSLGNSHGTETFSWLRHFSAKPGTSLAAICADSAWQNKPNNMCTWAFDLVQNDPSCLGLDFRLLHKRFSTTFRGIDARCRPGSATPCDGLGPNCLRYKGALVTDQSAHDHLCVYKNSDEPRMLWDEASYRLTKGARAVSIDISTSGAAPLTHCSASDKTLAISHVWSHGQGGRPEAGINNCLHQRYSRLARRLGCDSYWMDTVSIPEDHNLRREAISHINGVFQDSRAVLVCDRDLMNLNVSNLTTELRESLVAAVLLCDWNVRAWTILEGMKGRQRIFLLCKDNHTINLRETLFDVCRHGRLDIIVFANLFPHLLPSARQDNDYLVKNRIPEIPFELAGIWLSHRPASRAGDEIVIWSLLLGSNLPPLYNAVDFWKAQASVCTGYLMSSNSRLAVPGLTWAPSTPYTSVQQSDSVNIMDRIHRPMPRSETWLGVIHEDGLWGPWYFYEFRSRFKTVKKAFRRLSTQAHGIPPSLDLELKSIRARFGIRETWAALLQPVAWSEFFGPDTPSTRAPDTIHSDRYGRLVAVCESNKKEQKRRGARDTFPEQLKSYRGCWKGVYEWPEDVPLPNLKINARIWLS
jgi:hypothetical protein